jgi:hypothetical protein
MKTFILDAERQYLSGLLEAIQRCVYFLHASDSKITWPLDGETMRCRKKDQALFESLAAINERFAKLQDILAAAMRHAALLMGPATKKLCERAYQVFGETEYHRLAGISIAHLYNLRKSKTYSDDMDSSHALVL